MTLDWPAEKPVIRVTFDDFVLLGKTVGKASSYVVDLQVENISNAPFPSSDLVLIFYDAEKAIVGNSTLYLAERLAPGQKFKQQILIQAANKPATVAIKAKDVSLSSGHNAALHSVVMTIRSLPEGAEIHVDGTSLGVTPKALRVPEGSHLLTLSKPGYDKADYPFVVSPNESSGGTIEIELPSSNDIVELRDGSTLNGDVESMTWETVRIIVGGEHKEYPRNQIKRIVLVERIAPVAPPAPAEGIPAPVKP